MSAAERPELHSTRTEAVETYQRRRLLEDRALEALKRQHETPATVTIGDVLRAVLFTYARYRRWI